MFIFKSKRCTKEHFVTESEGSRFIGIYQGKLGYTKLAGNPKRTGTLTLTS